MPTLRSPRPNAVLDRVPGGRVRDMAAVGAYAVAVALVGRVSVDLPGTPVPVTGQSLAVVAGGMALGGNRAAAGAALHAAAGAAGLPGFAPVNRHTRGYVAGFAAAAVITGVLADRGATRTLRGAAATALIGHGVVLTGGATRLLLDGLRPAEVWRRGVAPFLPGAAVKSAVAALALRAAWRPVPLAPPAVPPAGRR